MKRNSKKCEGFSLIEVIISMMLIAIISVGVYHGYLMIIKQTKGGQVKQAVALAGKKTIEKIKSIEAFDGTLNLDGKTIILQNFGDTYTTKTNIDPIHELNKDDYIRLDKDYKVCEDQDYVYLEEITLTPTKNSVSGTINIDRNNKLEPPDPEKAKNENPLDWNLYLRTKKSGDELKYYISDNKEIKSDDPELNSKQGKIKIYIYIETINDEKYVTVKDCDWNPRLTKNLGEVKSSNSDKNEVNLYINCKDYNNQGTLISPQNVELNISNKNEEENCDTNIYLEKSKALIVDVKVNKGQANIYNNRSEDKTDTIGMLYDIKVVIKNKEDKNKEYEDKEDDSIFTGYSNQNINKKNK